MDKLREALQRIADRCPVDAGNYTIGSVGDIARAALAAPVADGPVAWRYRYKDRGNWLVISEKPAFLPAIGFECEPLYTRPAAAPAERGEYPPDAVIAQCMLAVDDPLLWGRLGENSGDMVRKFARAVIDADRAPETVLLHAGAGRCAQRTCELTRKT